MKKFTAVLVTVMLAAGLVSGCGNGGAGKESAPVQEAASEEAQSTAEEASRQEVSEDADGAENSEAPEAQEMSKAEETESGPDAQQASDTALPVVRVMALKGPTAMGMVQLMDAAEGGDSYEFALAASPDEVTPKLVQGEIDIAAVPANLSSVLYNNTDGQIQVLAVNTLGVLYIVENGDSIHSVSDLAGKTIYASGKGSTPEYALNHILSANGIDPQKDVTVEWKAEHSECVAAISSKEGGIAMLPQPFVTTAQMKNENIRTALDLTQEWEALQKDGEASGAMITGVVVVRSDFAAGHPEAVASFLDAYQESVAYVNANTQEASALIEKYDIVPAAVAAKALPYCNITFIEGKEMKEKLSGYLEVLFNQNPKAVGGALPAEDFYFVRQS